MAAVVGAAHVVWVDPLKIGGLQVRREQRAAGRSATARLGGFYTCTAATVAQQLTSSNGSSMQRSTHLCAADVVLLISHSKPCKATPGLCQHVAPLYRQLGRRAGQHVGPCSEIAYRPGRICLQARQKNSRARVCRGIAKETGGVESVKIPLPAARGPAAGRQATGQPGCLRGTGACAAGPACLRCNSGRQWPCQAAAG